MAKTVISFKDNAIGEKTIQLLDTDPVTPFENQLWINTTTNLLKYYDGTQIVVLDSSRLDSAAKPRVNTPIEVTGTSIDLSLGRLFYKTFDPPAVFTPTPTLSLTLTNIPTLDKDFSLLVKPTDGFYDLYSSWNVNINGNTVALCNVLNIRRAQYLLINILVRNGKISISYSTVGTAQSQVVGEWWSSGTNSYGNLGDGTTNGRSSPVLVTGRHQFVKISGGTAGASHYLGLKPDGTVWGWGGNFSGALGDNTTAHKSMPIQITGPGFIDVYAFLDTSFAIDKNYQLWAWGNGAYGSLGDGATVHRSSPVQVQGGHSFVSVVCPPYTSSGQSAHAMKADGSVWGWGTGTSSQRGDNVYNTPRSSPVQAVGNHSFTKIVTYAANSPGYTFVMALKANGQLWGWGSNGYGTLGINSVADIMSSPVLTVGNHSFIDVVAHWIGWLALKSNGSVWGAGANSGGILGDGTASLRSSPTQVLGGHSFIKIICRSANAFGLKDNGEIWGWGMNGYGQLGDNSITWRSSPVLMVGAHSFTDIFTYCGSTSGSELMYARKADGTIWSCGYNGDGRLGDGTTSNRSSPTLVIGGHSLLPFTFEQRYMLRKR